MTQKAIMTSRREFLSNALGIAFVAASPFPAGQPRSTQGQSKASTSHSGRTTQKVSLSWGVFLSPSTPVITSDFAPGETQRPWPPISSTLIAGERDAVLVDAPTTVEQARALANWVVASGKNLTTIYATHGHGDHFFGTSTVLERFPAARFVARPDVIKVMRQQASPESLATFWNPRFPGQISSHLAIAEELAGTVINLEGHDLVSVPLGFTDTASTTCLHVPSIGVIVAGDAAYNGVHLHLSESPDQQRRQEWIAALDKMESLRPRAVIAGHKGVGNVDSPKILGETRRYIRDFERLAMQTTTARELYVATLDEMKQSLGTPVGLTVFRKLKPLDYLTSYSHRGRYYTLREIARFDDHGLWSQADVWFSRFGTLLATAEVFVTRSPRGYFAAELARVLHVEVQDALHQLTQQHRVTREMVSGLYLYTAADRTIQRGQLLTRRTVEAVPTVADASVLEVSEEELKASILLFYSLLDEQQRRLYAGLESLKLGRGGDRQLADFLDLDPHTVGRGRQQLLAQDVQVDRTRKTGGGRKRVEKKRPK